MILQHVRGPYQQAHNKPWCQGRFWEVLPYKLQQRTHIPSQPSTKGLLLYWRHDPSSLEFDACTSLAPTSQLQELLSDSIKYGEMQYHVCFSWGNTCIKNSANDSTVCKSRWQALAQNGHGTQPHCWAIDRSSSKDLISFNKSLLHLNELCLIEDFVNCRPWLDCQDSSEMLRFLMILLLILNCLIQYATRVIDCAA